MTFETAVLVPVRNHLENQRISVPGGGGLDWQFQEGVHGGEIHLAATTAALSENMQSNSAAAPSFALCLAYWLERATPRPARVHLRVSGPAPEGDARRHWRRSLLILQQLARVGEGRFRVECADGWAWPPAPILNVASGERSHDVHAKMGDEARLERAFCKEGSKAAAEFSRVFGPIDHFRRQFPVGLFDGEVAESRRWTPAGASQVDLWARSADGKTMHLFELKADGKEKVGIFPEALYYATLLHHVRVGLADGRRIAGHDEALNSVRDAKRIVFWLAAPDFHPLVLSKGDSPLAWINEFTKSEGLEFRVLPIRNDPSGPGFQVDEAWPA